jgi:hypothetical protein
VLPRTAIITERQLSAPSISGSVAAAQSLSLAPCVLDYALPGEPHLSARARRFPRGAFLSLLRLAFQCVVLAV